MSEILVVGSLAYDSIQTPSGSVDHALGGSANYFSLASSLFAKVKVVGVVGSVFQVFIVSQFLLSSRLCFYPRQKKKSKVNQRAARFLRFYYEVIVEF